MNNQGSPRKGEVPGKDFFDYWQTLYEKEFQPFFNMPQFGLTRYYQEHVLQHIDKHHVFQKTLAEFTSMLLKSLAKSFQESDASLFTSNPGDNPTEAAKAFYTKWIRGLEKEYMLLFQSPEYVQCLTKAMETFNDFMISRQTVLEDILKLLPVPTNSEMDGLYKELYELKKRVQDLEKWAEPARPGN